MMRHHQSATAYQRNMSGLTMIEVLITISILSIGLLGLAAMQITGVRSANNSSLRTQATLLANDIIERMRANPVAIDDNMFMNISSTTIDCSTMPTKYCGERFNSSSGMVNAQSCKPDEMAAYDINVWYCGGNVDGVHKGGLLEYLPATSDGTASATITCIDTNPPGGDSDLCSHNSPHQVTIRWSEVNPSKEGAATVTQSISMTVQP